MKKTILIITSFSLIFLFSGCSGSDVGLSTSQTQESPGVVSQPETEPDVFGVIKSMTGNEIVIAEIDPASMGTKEEADEEEKDEASLVATPTRIPGSGMGGGGGTGSGPDDPEARIERLLENSTGQVKVLVPVGIAMSQKGEESGERKEASLSDLSSGQIVSIWLDQAMEDRQIAKYVSIR